MGDCVILTPGVEQNTDRSQTIHTENTANTIQYTRTEHHDAGIGKYAKIHIILCLQKNWRIPQKIYLLKIEK